MQNFVRFVILRHRFVLFVIAMITVAALYMISQGVIASSLGTMFFGEDPRWPRYLEKVQEYSNDNLYIFAWEEPDLFSAESNQRIRDIVYDLEGLPSAPRVGSLVQASWVEAEDGNLSIHNYMDEAEANPESVPLLRSRLMQDKDLTGLLISRDGGHVALVVEPTPDEQVKGEDLPKIRNQMIDIFAKYGIERDKLHSMGPNGLLAEVIEESYRNITTLLPWSALFLFVLGWILFHRIWPIVITLFVSGIADIWTVGFSVLLDREINLFVTIAPVVILIIATADVVHLVSAYLIELGAGKTKEQAIVDSASEVGVPCLLTSATTFLGFASMSFVPTPVFRQIGVVLGLGVGFALLLAVTLTPILFHLLPEPKPFYANQSNRVQRLIDRFLEIVRKGVIGNPKAIILVFSLIFVGGIYGSTQLHIDTDMGERFREGHPMRTSIDFFKDQFAGTNTLDLYIASEGEDSALDPDRLLRLSKLADQISSYEMVDRVTGLPTILAPLHRALTSTTVEGYPLATSSYTNARYLEVLRWSQIDAPAMFMNTDRSEQKLNIRLKTGLAREASLVGEMAMKDARILMAPEDKSEALGVQYLLGGFLDILVAGQVTGLLFAILTITIMMTIGTGSLKVGLWSMIPNLVPLFVMGAALAWTYDNIDSDTVMLGMIAIGIGVDDTIHFLLRYKYEARRADTTEEALTHTFNFAGRAIVITSLILLAGFSINASSNYSTFWAMGVFLPITLFTALLADLIMLPAMIQVGLIRFKNGK